MPLPLVVVNGVDRGDPTNPGVRDDLGLELLDRIRRQGGVAVDTEQIVGMLDQPETVVECADLLVRVLADVVDEHLGRLLGLLALAPLLGRPRTGELRCQREGVIRAVVNDHVDLVRQPGLFQQ